MKLQQIFFLLISLGFILSCSDQTKNTLILVTNRAEVLPIVELFNVTHADVKIQLQYRESLDRLSHEPYDILIGAGVNHESFQSQFLDLTTIDDGVLDLSLFYPELLASSYIGDSLYSVPLSFSLPLLLFHPESSLLPNNRTVNMEQLDTLSSDFNDAASVGTRPRFAYSPRWEQKNLYNLLRSKNILLEIRENQLFYDKQALEEFHAGIDTWISENSPSDDIAFQQKYLYQPPYALIDYEQIFTYFMTLHDFYAIPAARRSNLSFRYPAYDEKVAVLDSVVYLGINRNSKKNQAYEEFLAWFLSFETQQNLLRETARKQLRFFGILGGFSSLERINTAVLPIHYPELVALIPEASELQFPKAHGVVWPRVVSEVIQPYLVQLMSGSSSESLSEAYLRWRRQQPVN